MHKFSEQIKCFVRRTTNDWKFPVFNELSHSQTEKSLSKVMHLTFARSMVKLIARHDLFASESNQRTL